jgi:signal recognition particle subunit SRP54
MTPIERSKPSVIDVKKKKQNSKGFWNQIEQVNQLMKQFDQMSKMMKMMQGPGGKKSDENDGMKGMPGGMPRIILFKISGNFKP